MKTSTYLLAIMMLLAGCNGNKSTEGTNTKEEATSMESGKLVCLSFDDGPNTTTTPLMLETLKKHDVVASFFVIGQHINEESAKVMKQTYEMGCDIQNHSWTHSAMPSLSAEAIAKEIKDTSDKIEDIIGVRPTFFRPPYIAVNETMHQVIDLPFICGVGCEDWLPEVTAAMRAERIIKGVSDGSIILLHDFEGNEASAEALNTIIPELKRQGYTFVTITELFKRKGITPRKNVIYSNVKD